MKPLAETSLILLSVFIPSVALQIILRQYFSAYIKAGTSSLLRTSMQPFSSSRRASVLPLAAATLHSVQPPTFVRFLNLLYYLLSLSYFSHYAVAYFSNLAVTFFLHKHMRFLIVSFVSLT